MCVSDSVSVMFLGNLLQQPSTSHRRYSSEKHVTTSANQEKARTHVYGPPVPQDQPIRDRKSRQEKVFHNKMRGY